MTQKDDPDPKKQQGIDVDKIDFDEAGEASGLDDDVLDSVSGGLMSTGDDDVNNNCPCTNSC